MQYIKKSNRLKPKVSLILLDWSVRESFHLLYYLEKQNVCRELYEIIIIEYYSRISKSILQFESQVDSWLLLEMSEDCYYHKHLMYNAGIAISNGEVCVICDSDAMVKEGFIKSIINEFKNKPNIFLHIDQFRNSRKDLYPFSYPDFSEITGIGCVNNVSGKTKGVVSETDTIHNRNYGACLCARKKDLIAIGGADEHIDYLGHICGPYEMSFRLVNSGITEIWHQTEFMYHTWHPGEAGIDNYLGPHDGRNVSTTALDALIFCRIRPLEENISIKNIRQGSGSKKNEVFLFSSKHLVQWQKKNIFHNQFVQTREKNNTLRKTWRGFVVNKTADGFMAYPRILMLTDFVKFQDDFNIHAKSEIELKKKLVNIMPFKIIIVFPVIASVIYISSAIEITLLFLTSRMQRLINRVRA